MVSFKFYYVFLFHFGPFTSLAAYAPLFIRLNYIILGSSFVGWYNQDKKRVYWLDTVNTTMTAGSLQLAEGLLAYKRRNV